MKNRIFYGVLSLLTIFCIAFVISCKDKNVINPNTDSHHSSHLKSAKTIHFAVRHAGVQGQTCICPNCVCPGCPCPLGICLCGGFSNGPITDTSLISQGFGTASAEYVDSKLHLVFDQPTALENGTIPITDEYYFSKSLLDYLGIDHPVKLVVEIDTVNFSNHRYGEAHLTLQDVD